MEGIECMAKPPPSEAEGDSSLDAHRGNRTKTNRPYIKPTTKGAEPADADGVTAAASKTGETWGYLRKLLMVECR
jgi:hypothetical protein